MRDFIHRFYPYQALKLMLQRVQRHRQYDSARSTILSHSSSSCNHPPHPPFNPTLARSHLVSYFATLKQATVNANTASTTTNSSSTSKTRHQITQSYLGFHLSIQPSRIPNAGLGVFLRRRSNNNPLPAGTIVALYPGTLYRPGEAIFFTSLQNRYILKCEDGIFVDGKPTGLSGFIYRSANGRDNFPGIVPTADTTWMVDWSTQVASLSTSPSLSSSSSLPSASSTSKNENNNSTGLSGVEGGQEGGQRQQEGIDTSGMLKNPLAVGQIVNNGTSQFPPNVRYQELDIQTRDCPLELQEFLPNIWYSGDWHSYDHEHDEQQQNGEKRKEGEIENERERRNMDRIPGSGGLDRLRTVVLVTTRPIEKDEELYSTYIE